MTAEVLLPWVRKGTGEHFSYITYLSLFLCHASHFSRARIHHNVTCRKVSFERNEVLFYQNRKPLQPRGLVNMFSASLRGLRCQKGNVNVLCLIVQNTDRYDSIYLSTVKWSVSRWDYFVLCCILNFSALKEAIRGVRSLCLNSGYNVSWTNVEINLHANVPTWWRFPNK